MEPFLVPPLVNKIPWFKGSKPKYPNAFSKKVFLWSDRQIAAAKGLEKPRKEFYNRKVEELCTNKETKQWTKTEIIGAADTAWILKKTEFLHVETQKIQAQSKGVNLSSKRKKSG